MPQALIVEDDPTTLMLVSDFLEDRGFETRTATSLAQASDVLDSLPDLCICDIDLPQREAFRLAEMARAQDVNLVLVTTDPEARPALPSVDGKEPGLLVKPISRLKLDRVLARFRLFGRHRAEDEANPSPLIGGSPEIAQLRQALTRVGPSDATVLIVGESGTGKELVASELHRHSHRSKRPFLALNCGAVTASLIESELFGHERGSFTGASRRHAGYFERANGGTLFLDEVTEMPLELQVRLLRVLETRRVARVGSTDTIPVDVRVIAATNRDPREAVRDGKLREDLLYRLQVVPIAVPPLRARTGDVRRLAEHFLQQFNRAGATDKSFTEAALEHLESYHWPGNVRELYNVVQRAYLLCERNLIQHGDVKQHVLPCPPSGGEKMIRVEVGDSLAEVERRLIEQTLQCCRTREEAARLLGISTKTLYNKLRLYETAAQADPAANAPSYAPARRDTGTLDGRQRH
jgi:DNA-binding NtrC family response regulator